MKVVIDIPTTTEKEIENEFEKQAEDFIKRGLLPTESEE